MSSAPVAAAAASDLAGTNPQLLNTLTNYSNMFSVRPGSPFGASQGALNYFNTMSPEDQANIVAGMQKSGVGVGPFNLGGQAALNHQLNQWFQAAANSGSIPGIEANTFAQGGPGFHRQPPNAAQMAALNWSAPQPQGGAGPAAGVAAASGALNAFNPANSASANINNTMPNPNAGQPPAQPAAPPPTDYKALQEEQRRKQEQRAQYSQNRQNPPQQA